MWLVATFLKNYLSGSCVCVHVGGGGIACLCDGSDCVQLICPAMDATDYCVCCMVVLFSSRDSTHIVMKTE